MEKFEPPAGSKLLTKPNTPYYQTGGIEPIDYIVANGYDFLEGNVIKYLDRYQHKGGPLEDLKKLRQYVDWLIEREEWQEAARPVNTYSGNTFSAAWQPDPDANIKPGGSG